MASRGIMVGLVLVLAAAVWPRSAAQSGCTAFLVSLAPCVNFITGNSSAPSSTCCSQLAGVVQASPRCLCSVTNGPGTMFGIPINQTLALALPNACNVKTPPVSQCNAAANAPATNAPAPADIGTTEVPPVASPSGSPAEPSDETPNAAAPAASTTPAGTTGSGGSKDVPSTKGNTSNGSIVKAQLHLAALVVLVASIFKRL